MWVRIVSSVVSCALHCHWLEPSGGSHTPSQRPRPSARPHSGRRRARRRASHKHITMCDALASSMHDSAHWTTAAEHNAASRAAAVSFLPARLCAVCRRSAADRALVARPLFVCPLGSLVFPRPRAVRDAACGDLGPRLPLEGVATHTFSFSPILWRRGINPAIPPHTHHRPHPRGKEFMPAPTSVVA